MTIGIDGNEANVNKKVGISEYAYQLISFFSEHHTLNMKVFLKENPKPHMPTQTESFEYETVGPSFLWTQIALPIRLFKKRDISIFFTTSHYAPRFCNVPVVISVMDLSYIHFPELFTRKDLYQLTRWTAYSVKKAKKIITISKSSKNDIINKYKIPASKIEVVYPGIKKTNHALMKKVPAKYNISGKYILYVGTLQPRKNLVRLIEAFSMMKSDYSLVLVGKKGWLYDEILSAPEKYDVVKRVKFLDFVSDEDLPSFYQNAECFVLPSLYEGFGLPILEAMQLDCPVITSNVSSLPEAGGDAAVYFDPMSTTDMKEKIESVLNDEIKRKEMIEKGREHVKKFSWEKSAKQVLSVLEKVAKS